MTQAMTIANTYKRESRYFIGASKRITISIWFEIQVSAAICVPADLLSWDRAQRGLIFAEVDIGQGRSWMAFLDSLHLDNALVH